VDSKRQTERLLSAGLKSIASCGRLLYHKHLGPLSKLHILRSFIRPTIEYGLPLVKATMAGLKKLENVQNRALRACLGLPKNASIQGMQGVAAVEPLTLRNAILKARLARRLQSKDASFLVHHAKSSKLVKAVMKVLEEEPEIAAAVACPARTRQQLLNAIKLDRWNESKEGAVVSRISKQSWEPDKILCVGNARTRYNLMGWRFCLTVGEPDQCPRCPEPHCSWKHAIVCSGAAAACQASLGIDPSVPDPISVALDMLSLPACPPATANQIGSIIAMMSH
jgi:hypothetical protein